MEYTQRVQKELRRKHALQNKQQPKNLRRKKQQIHKQFEATCKIIESQVCDYLNNPRPSKGGLTCAEYQDIAWFLFYHHVLFKCAIVEQLIFSV